MTRSDDPRSADVFDFVDAYLASRERGEDPPLSRWLERFPESQDAIAREWLALRAEPGSAAASGESDGRASAPAEDRIGPYRLIRELGRGGQGAVFLAEDVRIGRRVALKILTTRFETVSDEKRRRFRREAEIIARLEHPSLCTVYDADLTGETPYIAMRYVEGRTLADVLAEARRSEESSGSVRLDAGDETTPRAVEARFPPRSTQELHQVLLFFERAARALHAAHEAGVVHRDVKPGNVIVNTDGKPVLLDFGLARDERGDQARITESGEVFGTPAYMSPEQLELPSDQLDRRTDEYSLGVALYEALTLRRPFEQAARAALYVAIQSEPMPDPRGYNATLPEDVAVVLATALEKERGRRYATALELAEDLRRIRQYEPIRARPAGVVLKFTRWVRRHPALAAATIGTILSLSVGLAVSLKLLADLRATMSVALGKHLAQRSVALAGQDASAALALGIEGVERAPNYITRSLLYPALEACWLERVLEGEDSARVVTDIEACPGSSLLVASFDDGIALVWDLENGQRVARLARHTGRIEAIALAPSGTLLATASLDGSARLWRLPSGSELASFDLDGPVADVAFDADGHSLLIRTAAGALHVVDTEQRIQKAHTSGPFQDARWCGNGLIVALGRKNVHVLDGRSLEGRACLLEADAEPTSIAASPAGDVAAVGTRTGEVMLFEIPRRLLLARVVADSQPIRSLTLSPDGSRLGGTSGPDDAFRPWLWDFRSERVVPLEGHAARPTSPVRFSPDGRRVATASHDLTVRVWRAEDGSRLNTFSLPRRHLDVCWSLDGTRLLSRPVGGIVYVWFACARPDTFDLVGHSRPVRSLDVAPDGRTVVTASDDGTARLWSIPPSADPRVRAERGAELARFVHGAPLVGARFLGAELVVTAGRDASARIWGAHDGGVERARVNLAGETAALAVAPNGERFALLDASGAIAVWSRSGGSDAGLPIAPAPKPTSIAFLSDGRALAIGKSDGSVEVVDTILRRPITQRSFVRQRPGEADARADRRPAEVVCISAHPHRNELAVACADQWVHLWPLDASSAAIPEINAFEIRALRWEATGARLLALGRSGNKAVRILDPLHPKEVISARNPHGGEITCADVSPDGSLALTGATDGSAFVWTSRDGEPVVQRTDLGAPVRCVAFAPDGADLRILTGLEDGSVKVWPVDPLPAARARKPRELSEDAELPRERTLAAPLVFDR